MFEIQWVVVNKDYGNAIRLQNGTYVKLQYRYTRVVYEKGLPLLKGISDLAWSEWIDAPIEIE